jgi:PAS domain S-box-containing protein
MDSKNANVKKYAQKIMDRLNIVRILDNMPTPVAVTTIGPNSEILLLNAQFIHTFGYSREEIPTVSDWARKVYPDEVYRDASMGWWEKAVAEAIPGQAKVESKEFSIHCKNGQVRDVLISTTVMDGLLVNSLVDVTEQKRIEQELKQARDAADLANEAKSQFLARMSHEIRTPLNGVLGLAQMLNKESLTLSQHKMVENILGAGNSLLSIISDILDFSKIEAGKAYLDFTPFELSQVLNQVLEIAAVTSVKRGIGLHLEPLSELIGTLLGDAPRLQQVLFNLVGNAIKFTEQGEVKIQVHPVNICAEKIRLRFAVQDSGIGMSPESISHLFKPFVQADGSISRRFGGTGLGLSISKQLIEMMGGEIGVTSTLGTGSTFWFELNFDRQEKCLKMAESKVTGSSNLFPSEPLDPAGFKVLCVDDNEINLNVLDLMLKKIKVHSTLCKDGFQALQILKARPKDFDLVLMDIQMPVMDGLAVTREIRGDANLTQLPVVALTAGVFDEERKAAKSAGINDYLTKPIGLTQLAEIVKHYQRI